MNTFRSHIRFAVAALWMIQVQCATSQFSVAPWDTAVAIVARSPVPVVPRTVLDVTRFGARGDGITDCSAAFRDAITACSAHGGGRVLVPPGVFRTGPIHLTSNIELHLSDSATIRFDPDPHKYLPAVRTRWEGVECMNYSPLIYAYEASNVAVTGNGTLDGGGTDSTWWPWSGKPAYGWTEGKPLQKQGRDRLFAMGEAGVPVDERVMGEGQFLRPNFIQMYRCRNVVIRGVRIIRSPMWIIHPVLCTGVLVENVYVFSHGPNNDGCDPESSRDVVIRGCTFDTGDDCIAIKSGRNNDGRRLHTPSENIVIQDCMFRDGHGAVTIGSEVSGGARGVYARRCSVESPILYNALRIKTNAVRGGTVEHVYVRDMTVRLVGRAAIDVDLFYEEGKAGAFLPTVQFISVESMSVASCDVAFNLVGYEEAPLRNILLRGCTFTGVQHGYKVHHVDGFQAPGTFINGKAFTPGGE